MADHLKRTKMATIAVRHNVCLFHVFVFCFVFSIGFVLDVLLCFLKRWTKTKEKVDKKGASCVDLCL